MAMAGAVAYSSLSLNLNFAVVLSRQKCGSGTTSRKHADRLLSSLYAVSGDSSAADRLIRKFVASSSKSTALQALSHILCSPHPSSPAFAISMYGMISEEPWFRWNPKLAACVAALLEKGGRSLEAESLISHAIANLGPRDIDVFRCALLESYAQYRLKDRVFEVYARLVESPFAGRRAYESMAKGLCLLELPVEAEAVVKEMETKGLRPSAFEFRSVVQSYGRLGRFVDMKRVLGLMEDVGWGLDTVCANVVLSCYGDHGEFWEMLAWLRKMRSSGVPLSIRSYNSVLNSCPVLISIVQNLEVLPLSIDEVVGRIEESSDSDGSESQLVQELTSNSEVLAELSGWSTSEWKLDFHGCHLGTAFVILLLWIQELRTRFLVGKDVPLEISIVCGSGKNSSIRGESPVKALVSKMMFLMESPLKIDRKNPGRFLAKGKNVKEWLYC